LNIRKRESNVKARALMITDSNQACITKMSGCGLQEGILEKRVWTFKEGIGIKKGQQFSFLPSPFLYPAG